MKLYIVDVPMIRIEMKKPAGEKGQPMTHESATEVIICNDVYVDTLD